jgi:hypothetical protein
LMQSSHQSVEIRVDYLGSITGLHAGHDRAL